MRNIYIRNVGLLFLSLILSTSIYSQTANLKITVTSPSSVSGDYDGYLGGFGQELCDINLSGELRIIEDSLGGTLACDTMASVGIPITNDLTGFIAVLDRGACTFVEKAKAAQDKGAIGVMICNNDGDLLNPGGESEDITIPVFMVSKSDCDNLKVEIGNSINVNIVAEIPTLEDVNADDKIVWGANGEGNFDAGLGGWTLNGISDASHVWELLDGTAIVSKSGCGDAAVFDLTDYQANDGFDFDNPPDPPYTMYVSELISPTINLSGVNAVALKFRQINYKLNGNTQIATSTDGGTTWSEPKEIATSTTDDERVTEIIRIPVPELANEANAQVKFIMDGDFYFWVIDDVELVELGGVSVTMEDAFYTPLSYGFPASHADSDTFFFFSTVRNSGGVDLTNVKLDVEVRNLTTEELIFSDSGSEDIIRVGDVVPVFSDNLFVPTDLPAGVYSMDYTLSTPDGVESFLDDNTSTKLFEVTEDVFSKEPFPDNAFGLGRPWSVATVYRTSKNVTDYVALETQTLLTTNATTLTDNFFDIFLVKLNEGLSFTNFDFFEIDLAGHPSFEIISQNTHVYTNEGLSEVISVPFSSTGQGVPLEPGETYMVIMRLDDTQAGSAAVPNANLFVGYNEDPRVANVVDSVGFISDLIVDNEEGRWFSGFQGDPAPTLRMKVGLSSDTDDTPLPVGAFSAYPNPTLDHVNARLSFEEVTDVTLILASLDGRIIKTRELANVSNREIRFDVSQLTAGTYILKAYTEFGSSTEKIVIVD